MADTDFESSAGDPPHVPLLTIFLCFLRLGTTSFGGGTVGWTHREVVERRGWIPEEKFLQILTVAQVLPGANPVNLAVYVGLQLRGRLGAAVAALGVLVIPFCIVLVLGAVYAQVSAFRPIATMISGLACVGVASILVTSMKSAKRLNGNFGQIAVATVIFIAVGIVHLPMVPVVLIALPVSIGLAYISTGEAQE